MNSFPCLKQIQKLSSHRGVCLSAMMILTTATSNARSPAKAQYLITGDTRHLLPIKEFQGIRILSPASFLTLTQMDEA